MFKHPLALRTRLALGYSVFFVAILTLLSAGVYLTVQSALFNEVAQQLQTSSDLIQQDFDVSDYSLGTYFDDPNFLQRTHPPHIEGLETSALYVQVLNRSGTVIVSSSNLQQQQLPITSPERAAILDGQPVRTAAQLQAARVYILGRALQDNGVTVGILLVAQPLMAIDRTLQLLFISLIVTDVVALFTAIRAGAWLARGALAPVEQISQTAEQIVRAEDLAQRIPQAQTNDEIGHLARTVNAMLERLDALFIAQRRFVADVSHELRTPLTAMRGNLEVLRRGAVHDPVALDEALADIEREVVRLARLTNDLLVLAQVEGGASLPTEVVALDELVLEVVREMRPLANGTALKPAIAEQVAVPGDRGRLKQALINLVANALQHTPPTGSVVVGLARVGGSAELYVRDSGAGIAPDDLPHVFEPFYRGDKARTRHVGGAGIGLAIVQRVTEAHGGHVHVASVPGEGSTFIMRLPLAPEHTRPTEALLPVDLSAT
jgi:signal transduction histidine kinase